MNYKFIWLFAIAFITIVNSQAPSNNNSEKTSDKAPAPQGTQNGAPYFEEIVVESNLNIRDKPPSRQRRQLSFIIPDKQEYLVFIPHNRQKRQLNQGFENPHFRRGGRPQSSDSQSASNANSNSFGFRPDGSDSAFALAGAQGFQSNRPSGSFGASSSNTLTDTIHSGPGGIQGNAGFSASQSYLLPNGQTLNLGLSNSFNSGSFGAGPASSQGRSVAFSG